MKPCPFCGTMLTAALVASIIDPKQEEFCPKNPPLSERGSIRMDELRESARYEGDAFKRLAAYALLGSLVSA